MYRGRSSNSVPRTYTLVKGTGSGPTEQNALAAARYDAGIGNFSLFRLSSILPPYAVKSHLGDTFIPSGSIVPIAYAEKVVLCTKEGPGKLAAAVSVSVPAKPTDSGLIMERTWEASLANARLLSAKLMRAAITEMGMTGMQTRKCEVAKVELSVAVLDLCAAKQGEYYAAFAGVVLWSA